MGLSIVGGVVAINTADLVGNSRGLKTVGNCGIEVNAGCGLKFNFDELVIDADFWLGMAWRRWTALTVPYGLIWAVG